jgi:DNA modification methylase
MKYTVVGQQAIDELPTRHRLIQGDARDLSFIPDGSIHLVVTSPPYWTLKVYNDSEGQMGHIEDYEHFLHELNRVWAEAWRVLVPGGRLVCVVGDVCLSHKENHGRHTVVPLHADLCVQCRRLGFDNLNPIIWHKISNASYEVSNGSKFLGKPYEPNAIIKNDIEFILMQRKPGGYRQPTAEQRRLSMIPKDKFDQLKHQKVTVNDGPRTGDTHSLVRFAVAKAASKIAALSGFPPPGAAFSAPRPPASRFFAFGPEPKAQSLCPFSLSPHPPGRAFS